MENFKTYYDKGTRKRIGFFPGGFKPPHAGHFAALQSMLGYDVKNPETGRSILLDGAETSDYVYVIVGHTPRGSQDQNDMLRKMKARKNTSQQELDTAQEAMITKDMSIKIWELFITQGDSSLKGKVDVSISPHASPLIGMEQKILSLDGKDIENSIINLYAGAEDQARYQYFISDKFKLKVAEEKNIDVDDIQIKNNIHQNK